jgi:hypothetical protein
MLVISFLLRLAVMPAVNRGRAGPPSGRSRRVAAIRPRRACGLLRSLAAGVETRLEAAAQLLAGDAQDGPRPARLELDDPHVSVAVAVQPRRRLGLSDRPGGGPAAATWEEEHDAILCAFGPGRKSRARYEPVFV